MRIITSIKYKTALIIALLLVFYFSPLTSKSQVQAKGGSFHVEIVTDDGFENSSNFDFNDGLVFNSYMYVTSDTFLDVGRIYRSSTGGEGSWSLSTTAGFGDSNNIALDAMIEFESNLYVTTDNLVEGAEMWRSANGSDWTAVVGGGAAVANGFGDANNVIIRETAVFDDPGLADQYLWAFTDNDTDGTEFWRSTDGTAWNETTEPAFTDANETQIVHGFEYDSKLFIFVLDSNDGDDDADDVEVWYTSGDAVPVWTQLNTASYQNLVNDALYLFFTQHGGNLYVGNLNDTQDGEVWVSADGLDYTLSETFTGSYLAYPAFTSKGLIIGAGYFDGTDDEVGLFLYSGGVYIDTGITIESPDFYFAGSSQFGDYYYSYGGVPGTVLRADLRPTTSVPVAAQTQLGDGVVEIEFIAGDITDADNLRAKVEYNIGGGYQKAALSEEAGNISSTYGTVNVENDNNYQVGNAVGWITTSSGANTISVKWLSKTDEPTANTTNANIRVTIYDGVTTGGTKIDSLVTVDNMNPQITSTNLIDGQSISGNPFIIQTQATDSAAGVWKVEFYVDDTLICTDYVADANGNYSCSWNTEIYQSDVEILAFDQVGNTDTESFNLYVTLPDSGDNISYLAYFSLIFILYLIAFRKHISPEQTRTK